MSVPSQPTTKESITLNKGVYEFVCRELEATHRCLDEVGMPTIEDDGTGMSVSQRVQSLCKAYQREKTPMIALISR